MIKNKIFIIFIIFTILMITASNSKEITVTLRKAPNNTIVAGVNSSDWWDDLDTPADLPFVYRSGDNMTGALKVSTSGEENVYDALITAENKSLVNSRNVGITSQLMTAFYLLNQEIIGMRYDASAVLAIKAKVFGVDGLGWIFGGEGSNATGGRFAVLNTGGTANIGKGISCSSSFFKQGNYCLWGVSGDVYLPDNLFVGATTGETNITLDGDDVLIIGDAQIKSNLWVNGNINVSGCIQYNGGKLGTCL